MKNRNEKKNDGKSETFSGRRRADLVLIIIITALALFLMLVLQHGTKGERAVVLIDGKETESFDLAQDGTFTINTENGGKNVLVISNGTCYMKESNCPDHICVKEGVISRKGQSIICLPHHLVIQITGGRDNEIDATVR